MLLSLSSDNFSHLELQMVKESHFRYKYNLLDCVANAVTALGTEHLHSCWLDFWSYCLSTLFGPACRAAYTALATVTNVKTSSAQTGSKLGNQNDQSVLFTNDRVHCYFAGKNIAHRLSTAATDGPKGTSHLRVFATDNCALKKPQVSAAFI